MGTTNQNSVEVLRAEILAAARRESDAICQDAQGEADARLAKAAADADQSRQERLQAAHNEAARRRELILATIPVEAGRLRSARTEEMLESVHEEIRRRLLAREGVDYRETVITLAAEAMKQMPGDGFVVKLSAADCPAAAALAKEISNRVGRLPLDVRIAEDVTGREGVFMVEGLEGRLLWDNNLSARLQRLWPELRREIAMRTKLVAESKPAGDGA